MSSSARPRLTDLIGARIRALRNARGMSVNSLASAAGVSAGIVSQIERDLANPSLNTIEKICAALGVATDAVLSTEALAADPGFVCRAGHRSHILVGSAPILKEMISPPGNRSLRMMIISLPPHSENLDVVRGAGQKAGLVMQGEARITVNGQSTTLLPGDSFQFASDQPHSLHNDSAAPAQVLWVIAEGTPDGAF
ncbi:helix-turn-helix domain-containing protein [Rhodovarius lipocyclicus]|uniref:helix-turn-helix domain-containing protein n=1 Tax=Rhodovarius lipocyclicus TaxID=268410 RepID=UPI001357C6B5|nr:helix-turn-helix domain-containing protein [Rhodovarius lipocyclicus]